MPRKLKIPKKIAGVKLPKQARKTANKAIKMGASPVVREIAVAAIGAAGGKTKGESKAPRTDAQSFGASGHAQIDLGQISEAFRTAAIDGLRRFLEGFEEGLRELNARAEAAGETARRKPASRSRPGAG